MFELQNGVDSKPLKIDKFCLSPAGYLQTKNPVSWASLTELEEVDGHKTKLQKRDWLSVPGSSWVNCSFLYKMDTLEICTGGRYFFIVLQKTTEHIVLLRRASLSECFSFNKYNLLDLKEFSELPCKSVLNTEINEIKFRLP